ncbi:MAG: type II toxin-antitoxin system HicA family toxin [Treponema sp.]|jgi:predicted RNA binding protein YcfA (HicA-like mRNA interferase family)|nr:type II toxin-antitoxin system HicA family toxin [Treponema sp.]
MPIRYTAKDLEKVIQGDGWQFVRANGSHHHYTHPAKKGTTTILMHKGTMNPKTAKSILKQAGLQ